MCKISYRNLLGKKKEWVGIFSSYKTFDSCFFWLRLTDWCEAQCFQKGADSHIFFCTFCTWWYYRLSIEVLQAYIYFGGEFFYSTKLKLKFFARINNKQASQIHYAVHSFAAGALTSMPPTTASSSLLPELPILVHPVFVRIYGNDQRGIVGCWGVK